jgi:hypothetical protein
MTRILGAISSSFFGSVVENDTLFAVLMFTITGLLLCVALVLAGDVPSFAEFATF